MTDWDEICDSSIPQFHILSRGFFPNSTTQQLPNSTFFTRLPVLTNLPDWNSPFQNFTLPVTKLTIFSILKKQNGSTKGFFKHQKGEKVSYSQQVCGSWANIPKTIVQPNQER